MGLKNNRGFEVIHKDGKMPVRGSAGSAGYDLYNRDSTKTIPPQGTMVFMTGVAAYMPANEWLMIKPRSGLSTKGIMVGAGVVDADYFPNEIGVVLHNISEHPITVEQGERIAQAIFCRYYVVDEDKFLVRYREGGFGSTGVF